MNIGEPKEVREIEPLNVPVPEPVKGPEPVPEEQPAEPGQAFATMLTIQLMPNRSTHIPYSGAPTVGLEQGMHRVVGDGRVIGSGQ